MGKRIGIVAVCLILAFGGFVYLQKEKAARQLTEILAQQGVELHELSFSFFPQPAFTAGQVRYPLDEAKVRSVFFEKIELRLSGLHALFGRFKLNRMQFENGKLQAGQTGATDFHSINLTLQPTALFITDLPEWRRLLKSGGRDGRESFEKGGAAVVFSGKTPQNDRIDIAGDIHVGPAGITLNSTKFDLILEKPTYAENKNFTLEIGQGYIGRTPDPEADYEISGRSVRINQADFGRARMKIYLPQEKKGYRAEMTASVCNDCTALLEFEPDGERTRKATFRAKAFPLDKLLAAFKLPVLITGESDVQAEIFFYRNLPTKGKFGLEVTNGKIKGLSLLSLANQYLPVKFNEGGLTEKDLETGFERFSSRFNWQEQEVNITEMSLRTPELVMKGQGRAELANMQCDVVVNIGINDRKYRALSLPVRFFDSCYSPQYKVEINQDFRDQLKSFIKEKFN